MEKNFNKSKIVASGKGNVKIQGYEPEVIALYSCITKAMMEKFNFGREYIIEMLNWMEESED